MRKENRPAAVKFIDFHGLAQGLGLITSFHVRHGRIDQMGALGLRGKILDRENSWLPAQNRGGEACLPSDLIRRGTLLRIQRKLVSTQLFPMGIHQLKKSWMIGRIFQMDL